MGMFMKVFVVQLSSIETMTRFYFMNADTNAPLACAQIMDDGIVDAPVYIGADSSIYSGGVVLRGDLLVIMAVMDIADENINDQDFLACSAAQHKVFDLPDVEQSEGLPALAFEEVGQLLNAFHALLADLRARSAH